MIFIDFLLLLTHFVNFVQNLILFDVCLLCDLNVQEKFLFDGIDSVNATLSALRWDRWRPTEGSKGSGIRVFAEAE